MSEVLFTASQIARSFGVSAPTMRERLKKVPKSGKKLTAGNLADAWRFDILPAEIQSKLQADAMQRGFRDAESLLRNPCELYKPALPLNQIAEEQIAEAIKLRSSQAEMLRRRNDTFLTAEELNQIGCKAYQSEFGHAVSSRYIRELFSRTLDRAGASEDFSRLELYLPVRLKRKVAEKQNSLAEIAELRDVLNAFPDPTKPTDEERQYLWVRTLEYFDEQIASGETEKEIRRNILDFIFTNAPWIAATREAFEKTFHRKLDKWTSGKKEDAAIADKRRDSKKLPRAGMSEDGWNNAVYLSGRYENIELAWREWRESEQTPAEDKARFQNASAWRAPKSWREAVKHPAKVVSLAMRGPRTYKLNSAHIIRDPDSLASGDADQCDDLTLPLIWWDELPSGEIFCGQGQLLAWIDERSWMIYNACLIPDGAYNGFNIRNSWTNKSDTWGLPRKFIYVENGIWRNAKVFGGTRNQVGTQETEMGLRRLGIQFKHAQLPRGKIIERVFGSIQDLLQREPGYAGRNQMMDRFELVQNNLKLVKSGKEHPAKFFLHKTQVLERFLQLSDKLNKTPKFGRYHEGRSPSQVYEECFNTPLVKIPNECRYQLADNKIETTVGRNGITFRYGAKTFNYKNYRTGQLRGQRVIAWFSPERPELLGVTNLDQSEPFVVSRSAMVPSHDASPEILTQANRENSEHNAYGKELMRSLKPLFASDFQQRMFRPTIIDAETLDTAKAFRRQGEVIHKAEKEHRTLTTKARRASAEIGFPVAPERLQDEGAAADMEFLNEWKKPKEYVLDSAPVAPTTGQFWRLWKEVEAIKPGLSRHALTQKALGCHPKVNAMTPEQLAKMIQVFSAILRDAKTTK